MILRRDEGFEKAPGATGYEAQCLRIQRSKAGEGFAIAPADLSIARLLATPAKNHERRRDRPGAWFPPRNQNRRHIRDPDTAAIRLDTRPGHACPPTFA